MERVVVSCVTFGACEEEEEDEETSVTNVCNYVYVICVIVCG